jgi:hypothetical protein
VSSPGRNTLTPAHNDTSTTKAMGKSAGSQKSSCDTAALSTNVCESLKIQGILCRVKFASTHQHSTKAEGNDVRQLGVSVRVSVALSQTLTRSEALHSAVVCERCQCAVALLLCVRVLQQWASFSMPEG